MQEGEHDNEGQNWYSHFRISGKDIAAFFIDGGSDIQTSDQESPSHSSQLSAYPVVDGACHLYSLVDRCGIVVIVDQVRLLQAFSQSASAVHFLYTVFKAFFFFLSTED